MIYWENSQVQSQLFCISSYFILLLDLSPEISFIFSDVEYFATEGPNAVIPVIVTSTAGIRLENPVFLTVSPLTFSQAIAQGVTIIEIIEDQNSPILASKELLFLKT